MLSSDTAMREAEGVAKGIAKGMAKGEAKGVLKQKKETALSMKEDGFPESTIAKILKVSPLTVRQWLADTSDAPLYQ